MDRRSCRRQPLTGVGENPDSKYGLSRLNIESSSTTDRQPNRATYIMANAAAEAVAVRLMLPCPIAACMTNFETATSKHCFCVKISACARIFATLAGKRKASSSSLLSYLACYQGRVHQHCHHSWLRCRCARTSLAALLAAQQRCETRGRSSLQPERTCHEWKRR